jgi:hypothetical protein
MHQLPSWLHLVPTLMLIHMYPGRLSYAGLFLIHGLVSHAVALEVLR